MDIDSKRVLVVGASSGLGRAIGVGLAARGARVALSARRSDRIADAVVEAGNHAVGLVCDVRNEDACRTLVAEAVEQLGGLDGLVYCAGIGHLSMLADATADMWQVAFETNVMGAALVTSAAVGHLEATRGRAIYLSSVSASSNVPWPGLAVYASTKAALDKVIAGFGGEHPLVGFTRIVMGESAGGPGASATEFAGAWEPALFEELLTRWLQAGHINGALVEVEDLVSVVATVLAAKAQIPTVTLLPQLS